MVIQISSSSHYRLLIIISFIFFSASSCTESKSDITIKNSLSIEEMNSNFQDPPDNLKPWTYYYWINNHVSKEGITKDLEAMKKVGIGTALIANMNLRDQEQGKVDMLSEEWKELTRYAIREGGRLGMDIGLFNCPGFSSSGGPWNDFANSMKYLDYTKTKLKGGKPVSIKLDTPVNQFEDVRLLAFPARDQVLDNKTLEIRSDKNLKNLEGLLDYDAETVVDITAHKELVLNFQSEDKETIRNLQIIPSKTKFLMDVDFYGEVAGQWKKIRSFKFNRSRDKNELGFNDYPPVSVSFPKVISNKFKLVLSNITFPKSVLAKKGSDKGIADIYFSPQVNLEYHIEKSLAKMKQSPYVPSDSYTWPDQQEPKDTGLVLTDDKIVDLTERLSADGTLTWDVPPGDWTVLRFVMVSTGIQNEFSAVNASGFEADKLNKDAARQHFEGYVGDIFKAMPLDDRKSLKYVIVDSYEVGAQNWTDDFADRFFETYHYDSKPYLPVLTGVAVNSVEESSRFLWDLRRLVADGLAHEYIAGLQEMCEENGFQLWLENYGHWGFPGEFLMYGGQSDLLAGEFWTTEDLGNVECRAAASAAHIYGKNIVYAESFTSDTEVNPFTSYPAKMKKRGDWSFTEGINHVVYHVYIHQPYEDKFPGVNAWFGTEINRKNTWFEAAAPWMKYHQRCNYLLQQGNYVADVAYYIGEETPKMTGPTEPQLPIGYAFDFINAEVIKNRISVSNGRMMLPDGLSYRILVLPDSKTMRPEVLEKIKELVYQGAIIMGNPPQKSPSLHNYANADRRIIELSKELWGESYEGTKEIVDFGKGKVIRIMDLNKALDLVDIAPDLKYPKDTPLLWIHRTLGDKDIYFLSNQSDTKISFDASFRVAGMRPSLWNPTNGTSRDLPQYKMDGLYTKVPLQLEQAESAFVVFGKNEEGLKDSRLKNYEEFTLLQDISKDWSVRLKNDQLKIDEEFELDRLQDLSQLEDETSKYFSGKIIYRTNFKFENESKSDKIFLNLGKVGVIANVKLNGKEIGGLWTAPWRLDLSDHLINGNNSLEIEVANLWVNQLVKDASRDKRQSETWMLVDHSYEENSPLPPSGLIGPVQLIKQSSPGTNNL
ncbi:MAG: glycoside hydrolase family 2 [Saprospiraceae bacterium]|nr:glycoside hydrolase family 2 [Saprospiraceae bacterium]